MKDIWIFRLKSWLQLCPNNTWKLEISWLKVRLWNWKKKTTGESKFVYFHLTDQTDFVSIATKFNLQTIGKNRKKLYFYTFLLTCCFNQSFWLIDVSKTDYFRPVWNRDNSDITDKCLSHRWNNLVGVVMWPKFKNSIVILIIF